MMSRDARQSEGGAASDAARRRRLVQLGVIAAFAAALVVALVLVSQAGDGSSGAPPPDDLLAGIEQDGTALGDPDAAHTLVEFGDPQCPFCAQFDRDVLPVVIEDYVRPGALRLEFRPLTFIGPESEEAARMAAAAGLQGHFWEFIDLFYRNQEAENSGYVDDDYLASLGEQIPGLDVERALGDRDSAEVSRELERAQRDAGEAGIDSVPSFLAGPTGGELQPLPVSALDAAEFTSALDAAIGKPTGDEP